MFPLDPDDHLWEEKDFPLGIIGEDEEPDDDDTGEWIDWDNDLYL
jgi:hypothetical protein